MERIYKVSECAGNLGCGESTLRKWMAALQAASYPWVVDQNGWRRITESDLVSLRKFQEALTSGLSVDEAAREVVENYSPQGREGNPLVRTSNERATVERLDKLEEQIEMLVQLNKELVRELKERDGERDRHLMETLRLMQETRGQIAAGTNGESDEKKRGGILGWLRRK